MSSENGIEEVEGVAAARDRSVIAWLCGMTLLSTAALGATGCSSSPRSHTLVFDITGEGRISTLTYVVNGKASTEKSVTLPWHRTIHLPAKTGKDTWSLKTQQGSGSYQSAVYVDGRSVTSGACASTGGGCDGEDSGSVGD